ncbi:MAG: multicopper oxidase domain-containing protein [Pseudomonadota bacterium]
MKSFAWAAGLLALLIVAFATAPRAWVPHQWRATLFDWFGAAGYRALPAGEDYRLPEPEEICPPDFNGWRPAQVIEGVAIAAAAGCVADNPYLVAAAVKGTNNVSEDTLLKAGLTPDALVKGRDLDGDGDPDEVAIRLEVMELNGASPDLPVPVTTYDIAPGIQPGMWVFTPKSFGMSTESFESRKANPLLRAPAPVIRVEQGDRVTLILENSHYLPHTIHLHGVDHPFSTDHAMPHTQDAGHQGHAPPGTGPAPGSDGVAETSELPALPGAALEYRFSPRVAGTFFYHCHVQANAHILMGMQGMFVVEENRPANSIQSLNIGAGQVRHPAAAIRETYDREYDLHYFDLFKKLSSTVQDRVDLRLRLRDQHRYWNITEDSPNYFLLNGRSFPYTLQESLVVVGPDERVKLRLLNGGSAAVAVHTHGNRLTVTHLDGIPLRPEARYMRDVVDLAPAQRVDVELDTTDDGLHNYGEGVWLMHDHHEAAQTTDGIYPGGSIGLIAFESYLEPNGFPRVHGSDWQKFFTSDYYRKAAPVWLDYDPGGLFAEPGAPLRPLVQAGLFGVVCAAFLYVLSLPLRGKREGGRW